MHEDEKVKALHDIQKRMEPLHTRKKPQSGLKNV
jgi:hypothetical protein